MTVTESKKKTLLGVLISLSVCHCCNDALQAVVASLYPILKDDLLLDFTQIGIITLFYQLSASVLQPIVGMYLDKKPNPYFIPLASLFTFTGLAFLAYAGSFTTVMLSVMLIGIGSSIIHPEASRLTSLASGGRKGLAQSIFQIGGNLGGSIGPLLAALFIAPYGRENTTLVALLAFVGLFVSLRIVRWYKQMLAANKVEYKKHVVVRKGDPDWIDRPYSDKRTYFYIGVLLVLIFSKYVYVSSITNYYTFYTIDKFGLSVEQSQYMLFAFVFATALGTLIGGALGDKIGRKYIIWLSILGATPFALALPYLNLTWSVISVFGAGFMLSSAFPAIVIFAQELLPNRVGTVSGLFFGFAFGIGGIAAALWGFYAESYGVDMLINQSAYVLLLGIVAALLPKYKTTNK